MKIQNWSYEDFPACTLTPAGSEHLSGDHNALEVLLIPDVEYAVMDSIPLHLQILKPVSRTDPDRKYPCIVYVQGSAWMKQDVHAPIPMVSTLARRGYVVAIVEYRHSGQAMFPAQVQDAKNAVRFMRKNAGTYCVDADSIFAAGCSSGGHIAMFMGIVRDDDSLDRNIFPGVSADVKGILNYYGAVDLLMEDGYPSTINTHLADSPEGMLLGGIDVFSDMDLARLATVRTHITPEIDLAPVCIFHGTKDRTVNCRMSVELYELLKDCGKAE